MKIIVRPEQGMKLEDVDNSQVIVGKDSSDDVFIVTFNTKTDAYYALSLSDAGVTTGNAWNEWDTIQEVLKNILGLKEAHTFDTSKQALQWVVDNL